MKIKISKEELEIEGKIEKRFVKPFGTSSHLPFLKEHLGKEVFIVIPSNPRYCWLLTEGDKKKLIKIATRIIRNRGGRLEHYYSECIKDLEQAIFPSNSLIKIVELLKEEGVERELIKKITRTYSI